jgi:hypothetical protein
MRARVSYTSYRYVKENSKVEDKVNLDKLFLDTLMGLEESAIKILMEERVPPEATKEFLLHTEKFIVDWVKDHGHGTVAEDALTAVYCTRWLVDRHLNNRDKSKDQ